jgi:RNA polymerase sigma-32 factor
MIQEVCHGSQRRRFDIARESGLARHFEEIGQFPMLEPHEEFILAKHWRQHGDRAAGHKLATSRLRLV